jgi:hypothetical protein
MKVTILISLVVLILVWSCRRVTVVDSSAEIISRSIDETLNDSALIYGFVYSAGNSPYPDSKIWIEGSDLETTSDIYGNFSLPVMPGTYTIKCLRDQYDERFTAIVKDITLLPNQKVEIRFYHGTFVE